MNNNQGALYFGAGIDMTQWRQNVNEIRRDILGLNATTQQQTKAMDSSFKSLARAVGTYFSGAALGNFTNQIINIRGEFQKTEIAFETMLGSADKAKELMAQMVDLAAKTPFSLQDVSAGAKQLLAFQVPADEVVDTLTRMGNIAAGLGVPLSRINLVYGQVMAKGKLMGDDLRQFTEAGIPMVAELAKKFGTTTAAINKMVSDGKVGFNDVKEVLFSLTSEGGMFFNLMEKQSKSLSGQIANLGDAWDQMLNKIGESNEGILSDSIAATTYLVENYETVIEVIGVAVASYGAYRAALIATAAWQQLSAGAALQQALAQGTLTTAQAYGAAATVALQRAQIGLNAAMMANPIGVVIGLIAGLTYVIYKNVTATNAYIDLQAKLKEENDKNNSSIDEQKSKIESLTNIIKNKNTTDAQAKSALAQINALTGNRIKGLTVEGIRLGQNTTALQGYIKMLELEARAKSLIATKVEAEKREREIRNDNYNDLSLGDRFGNVRDISDLKLGVTAQQRKRKALIEDLQAVWKTKAEIDRELAKLQAQGVNIGDAIAETATNATSTAVEETKKKARELDVEKIYSTDTIKGLRQRISKLNEIMETSVFGSDRYNAAEAEKQIMEERLSAMTRTFDQEIEEIKRQIQVRDNLLKFGYSKEQVDKMFPDVKDTTFIGFLEDTRKELELLAKGGSKKAAEDLILLREVIDERLGNETFIDGVTKRIDDLKSRFTGDELIKELEKLKAASLENETEANKSEKYKAVDDAVEAELDTRKKAYQDFLKEHETFEQKKIDITNKYKEIEKSLLGDSSLSSDERSRLLTEMAKARGEEYSQAFLDSIRNSDMWTKAFGEIALMTNSQMKKHIEYLKEQMEKLGENATPEQIEVLQRRILELQNAINANPFAKLSNLFKKLGDDSLTAAEKMLVAKQMIEAGGEAVNMVGDAFGGFDEATQNTIDNIVAIGSAASELGASIASGDVAGMIQSGLKLIGALGNALSGDAKKERQIQKWAAEVKKLESVYVDLDRAISKALGENVFDASKQAIANLRQQQQILAQMARTEASKKKGDKNKVQEYRNAIKDIDRAIEDMQQSMVDTVLNGMDAKGLADRLSDALVSAFMDGKDAAAEMGKAVDDILRDMVKNALKMKLLEEPMQSVVDKMLKSMGFDKAGNGTFDGLTNAEREELKKMMQSASQNYANALKEYEELFGQTAENAQGMKGDIKGVTEKTAGALESQINAMRINQVSGLEVMRNSLLNLVRIEENTRRLHNIDKNIQELNAKTKNNLAGVG